MIWSFRILNGKERAFYQNTLASQFKYHITFTSAWKLTKQPIHISSYNLSYPIIILWQVFHEYIRNHVYYMFHFICIIWQCLYNNSHQVCFFGVMACSSPSLHSLPQPHPSIFNQNIPNAMKTWDFKLKK